jgi:hypothetical protein
MERRGFLESFAKSTVGTVLALEDMLKEVDDYRNYKYHSPRVVKVTDETLLTEEGKFKSSTLKIVLKAGLNHIYPSDMEVDFIRTLFPGIIKASKVGIRIFPVIKLTNSIAELTERLIVILLEMASNNPEINSENFSIWDYSSSIAENEADRIIPYTELEQVYQFLIALISGSSDLTGGQPCRNAYLSCFGNPSQPDWLKTAEDKELNSVYENVIYPLGMKFRLFILVNAQSENTMLFASDGVVLDHYLSGQDQEAVSFRLIEIINPSAEKIANIGIDLRGEGALIRWEDAGYEGKYQIFRCDKDNFSPSRKYLIGSTYRKQYYDKTAEYRKRYHYIVTREWL